MVLAHFSLSGGPAGVPTNQVCLPLPSELARVDPFCWRVPFACLRAKKPGQPKGMRPSHPIKSFAFACAGYLRPDSAPGACQDAPSNFWVPESPHAGHGHRAGDCWRLGRPAGRPGGGRAHRDRGPPRAGEAKEAQGPKVTCHNKWGGGGCFFRGGPPKSIMIYKLE